MTDLITTTATLTKIVANPQHAAVRHNLRDIHRMHHTLTTLACPPDFGPASRTAAGLLYRVERTTSGVQILMQSLTRPDPDRLAPGYALAGITDLHPLFDQLHPGVRVRYRIRANPTKAVHTPGQRGIRQPLAGPEAHHWWARKADSAGLQLDAADTVDTATLRGERTTTGQHTRLAITSHTFDGIATVTDPGTLREAVLTGIGRARAYGCGLLSLALLC